MNRKQEESADLQKQINELYGLISHLSKYVGWQGIKESGFNFERDYNVMDESINSSKFMLNNKKPRQRNKIEERKNLSADLINNYSQDISAMMENDHKDILKDPSDNKNNRTLSQFCYREDDNVSCEDKLQRLTAQLTAAYQRIASLEEQLISHRQKTETRQQGFHHNH